MIPTTPVHFWEYFDSVSLAALTIVITTLLITHRKKNGSLLSSISKTVADSPRDSRIFSITMTIFFPLYYAFLWFWVGPLIGMPNIFYILLVFSAVCEMVFVWVPAAGRRSKVHAVAAAYVGLTMFILPLIILKYGTGLTILSEVSIYGFLIVSFCMLISLAFQKMRKFTLHYEVAFCVAFLAMISLIAHS